MMFIYIYIRIQLYRYMYIYGYMYIYICILSFGVGSGLDHMYVYIYNLPETNMLQGRCVISFGGRSVAPNSKHLLIVGFCVVQVQ